MPLILCDNGQFEVIKINGIEKQPLEDIGIFIGAIIKIISKTQNGLIVQLGQTRLALDKTIAKKIFVK